MEKFEVASESRKVSRAIRIRQEYYETLSALSKKTGVSFSKIVNQCIGYALDRMGNDEGPEGSDSAK